MKADPIPELPALRSLGDLADCKPVIVIDTREQNPLVFGRLQSVRGTLGTADYSVAGSEHLFGVERKSIQDLVACCTGDNRERFERELIRLRGFRFKRLLIVGNEVEIKNCCYRGQVSPKAVLATLSAFECRYDLPVVFEPTPQAAAFKIESWAYWFTREIVKTANSLLTAVTNKKI